MIARRTPMKRCPLKRTAVLRSASPMKGTRLAPMSAAKAGWNRKYAAEKRRRMAVTPRCERCKVNRPKDGHHPVGQCGERIMTFFLVCRECHDWIHANGKEAREGGWLV